MFVCCPKCKARYKISDDIQLPETQKFKCSACSAVFEQPERISVLPTVGDLPDVRAELKEKAESDLSQTAEGVLPSEKQPDLSTLSAEVADLGQIKRQTEEIKPDSLPEAFIPVAAPKRIGWGRGIIWFFVFGFVAAAGIFLYYKPASRWLENAVNRFAKDMMPAFGLHEETSPAVRVNMRSKPAVRPKTEKTVKPVREKTAEPVASDATSVPPAPTDVQAPTAPVAEPQVAVPAAEAAGQIKIRGVTFHSERAADGTEKLVVEGMVFNLSDKRVVLPTLTVRFENAAGVVVQSGEIRLTDAETAPKHAQSFKGVFPAVSDVTRVAVVLK